MKNLFVVNALHSVDLDGRGSGIIIECSELFLPTPAIKVSAWSGCIRYLICRLNLEDFNGELARRVSWLGC